MIKLSKVTDYAVVILLELSQRSGELLSASALSEITHIPESNVAKTLKILAGAELISSVRGVSGGYQLSNDAQQMSLADIVTATEGPIALTACVGGAEDSCDLEHVCSMKGRWDPVNDAIHSALDNVKLSDMVAPVATNLTPEQQMRAV